MIYFYIIYKLTFPNGKVYIGQTKNFSKRMSDYKNIKNTYSNKYLYRAIKKYKWRNIKQEILYTVPEEFVDELETKIIAEYNATDKRFGYNILKEAKTMRGFKHSEETKKMQSNLMIGRYTGKNNPMYGKKHSEEIKNEWSKQRKEKNNPMYGKKHSEESKEKNRQSHLGKKYSKERIQNASKARQKSVIAYNKKTDEFIGAFESIKQAGIKLKLRTNSISAVLKNRLNSTGGYTFKYNIGNCNGTNI